MVDALALGASGATHGGSSPLPRTKIIMNLPLQPVKGARDFYPEDKLKQDYMFSVIRNTVKQYGYEEYDAPILESLDLYLAKSGEEIVKEQTYTFIDRGGRKVAIRPEMTPTVSRMVAARRQQLNYPLRWFSIPNLWRYERPQRGRLREHWQVNVDIFGVNSLQAELELIMVSNAIFSAFKATSSMFLIKLNHRSLMDLIFHDYLELDREQAQKMAKLIDRMNKMVHSKFLDQVDSILTPLQKETGISEKIIGLLTIKNINDLPEAIIKSLPVVQLKQLMDSCRHHGIDNVAFDISLMRGFDYYSGLVFEVFDTHEDNNRSMMGGGRYDGLVSLFGVEPIATVGFGLGDATLANFLDIHGLMPTLSTQTSVYVAIINEEVTSQAIAAANKLRDQGINVAIDFSAKKLGDQLKTAQKKQINLVMIVGQNEVSTNRYTLKNLTTSNESKLSLEQIAKLASSQSI